MSVSKETGVIEDLSDAAIYNFKWEIDYWQSRFGKEETFFIESPILQTSHCNTANERITWKLRLHPNGKNSRGLFLILQNEMPVWATVNFCITNNKNNYRIERSIEKREFTLNKAYGLYFVVSQSFCLNERNLVPFDYKLSILCTIKIFREAPSVVYPSRFGEFDDFEKMLADEKTADVTFHIGTEKLVAHKAVLSCRSPVFKAMFDHNMQEKITNEVHVDDVRADVMKEIFRFIYSGKVNGIEKKVTDLLAAADKYYLEGLKQKCVVTLFRGLRINTVLQTLELAVRYNEEKLKDIAIKFVLSNKQHIVHKPEFQMFATSHPAVTCEIVRAMADENILKL